MADALTIVEHVGRLEGTKVSVNAAIRAGKLPPLPRFLTQSVVWMAGRVCWGREQHRALVAPPGRGGSLPLRLRLPGGVRARRGDRGEGEGRRGQQDRDNPRRRRGGEGSRRGLLRRLGEHGPEGGGRPPEAQVPRFPGTPISLLWICYLFIPFFPIFFLEFLSKILLFRYFSLFFFQTVYGNIPI